MSNLERFVAAMHITDSIIGSDEVGYGSWAGPLLVCALALPKDWHDPAVRDSKKLSQKQRECTFERYFESILKKMVVKSSEEIDRDGVWATLLVAHKEAIEAVASSLTTSYVVAIDGTLAVDLKGMQAFSLPKADEHIQAVALASIFAKVTRDRMMVEYAKQYPGYGFEKHCGYGTAAHKAALEQLGPCPIHRKSYKPIAELGKKPARDLAYELYGI